MELKNPQTWQYGHANFGTEHVELSLNVSPDVPAIALLKVESPGGRAGTVQIQPQDNGNVVVRVVVGYGASNPIHVLVLDETGIIFER